MRAPAGIHRRKCPQVSTVVLEAIVAMILSRSQPREESVDWGWGKHGLYVSGRDVSRGVEVKKPL